MSETETGFAAMKQMADLAPCGIGLYDLATSAPVLLNKAYYKLIGYTEEEYKDFLTNHDYLMFPEDLFISRQGEKAFESAGEARDYEYRIVRKNGHIRWVKLNVSKVKIGAKEYAFASFTDITKEKDAYMQLNMIAENMDSSVSIFKVSNGVEKLIYANGNFYKLLGIEPSEYQKNIHAYDRSFVSGEDHERIAKAIRGDDETCRSGDVEHRFLKPSGEEIWVNRHYRTIMMEEENTFLLLSVVTDITEKKKAELKAILERERFGLVIDEMNAAVFEWDLKTGAFYSSPAYQNYAISHVSTDDILNNRGPEDVVHPEDGSLVREFFADTKSGKSKVESTLRLKMTDGSYRWCRMVGFFMLDSAGAPSRTIGVIIDVNDERERSVVLDTLINNIPGGVAIVKIGEKIECRYYSEGCPKMIGITREEMEKQTNAEALIDSVIAPTDRAKVLGTIRKSAPIGSPINLTCRCLYMDGSIHWLCLSANKIREEDGVPVYYCVLTAPNDESALYRNIVEDSVTGIFVAERKARNTIYVNAAAARMFGYPEETKATGRPVDALLSDKGKGTLLTTDEIFSLRQDGYTQFHREMDGVYYAIKAKALTWNGVDSYILYISDETAEHDKQERLQNLVDEVPTGIGIYEIVDKNASLTYLNDAYYSMVGVTRENRSQYIGRNTLKAVHPDDMGKMRSIIQNIAYGSDRAAVQYRVMNGDGNWLWLSLTASVVERRAGYTKVYVAFADCDEMIRTQEALHNRYEDQVRYNQMLTSDSVASSMVNLTSNTITMQDTEDRNIMNVITQQTPQQGFESMYPCIPDENIRREYAAIFNSESIIAAFEKGIAHNSIRHPYMTLDCWFESGYNAVQNPKTGDLEVYCFAKDISKEVLQNDINEFLISHAYDEAVLIDPRTGEPKIMIDTGKSEVYAEQRTAGDFSKGLENYFLKYSADDNPRKVAESAGLAAVTKALEKQEVYSISYSVYDMQRNIIHRRASYAYLNRYKTLLLCTVQDITNAFQREAAQHEALRSALEEARKSNRAKADFYSRMSHDMRTPMNGILGMAELSENETDSAVLKENIKKISESGQYLLRLINDTLDIQRIEGGKMVLEPRIAKTEKIVSNIIDMVAPAAEAKGVELNYNKGNADLNWYIRADELRLKQIFVNLLSNAIKFTPSGGTVEFEFRLLSREGMISHDAVYVRDSGIGMSREFLQDGIFKPFSQESNQVSPKYVGSGLGLSIAKSLVELMGGRIEVESEIGAGTTFTVYLDFERVDSSEAERVMHEKKLESADFAGALGGKRILLVEDHPMNAEIAKKLLEKAGCEVTWVQNGKEGVDCFAASGEGGFDLVLMDIRMPVMDGLEASRRIRALGGEYAEKIPIVAMTANAYKDDVRETLGAGMNAHMAKPVEYQKLYETIARLTAK